MILSEKAAADLLKRIKGMNLENCRRMEANMPPNVEGIDTAIKAMIQGRIAQLKQEDTTECE
jgi:hypothetical protein